MSADRADPEQFVDERESDGWHDPYDIVPDAFRRRYAGCDSVREALRQAEQAATTSDADTFARCPECLSVKITRKSEHVAMDHKRQTAYKCLAVGCGEHFDEPAPSREDCRPGEQATLPEVDG